MAGALRPPGPARLAAGQSKRMKILFIDEMTWVPLLRAAAFGRSVRMIRHFEPLSA